MGSQGALPAPLARRTICLSKPEPNTVVHHGDDDFEEELGRLYNEEESLLLESLVTLKATLRATPSDDFWSSLSERLAGLLDAQMAFVSKRMLVDEQDRAVEMPPIGEEGSCLMASALYYNDGKGTSDTLKAFKYHAYGCPCGYMRHDKVFIIPGQLNDFINDNPNEMPFPGEAYIGVPLFEDGKCFAHFGVIWSKEGAGRRRLSWASVELALHALEDIVLERLLEGSEFRNADRVARERHRIIPHAAVTAAQSLKPYARSLSHELRTPMQGVVGMLDVMYATVLEASETQTNPDVRKIFEALRENIEVVQDSSRRAVEAADNVVHAYDMDMSLPDAPHSIITGSTLAPVNNRPDILVAGSNLPIERPNKRRREEDGVTNTPTKIHASMAEWAKRTEVSEELKQGVHEAGEIPEEPTVSYGVSRLPSPPQGSERLVVPGLRHTQLRNVIQYVVNEGLKNGGRPESAIARETEMGELIEVRLTKSTGETQCKIVEWSVDPAVPTTMFVDEKDLGKLVTCVFLNAFKFTEKGKISVHARVSSKSKHVVIDVTDTGPGIPKTFLPKLFKPFSQEDPSLTRQSEGLGLGLLVAKGIARKLGGDLVCTRTETEGPNHGSNFEIRIPVSPTDHISRPPSPFASPSALASPSSRSSKARSSAIEDVPLKENRDPCVTDSLPTPTEQTDEQTPAGLTTSTAASAAAAAAPARRPNLGLMRKPSLPQTPRHDVDDNPFPKSAPSHKETISATIGDKTRSGSTITVADSTMRPPMGKRKSSATISDVDRELAAKHPLTFLVAEDNKINRKLLVSMLTKFGYKTVHEAYDGAEAVRQMERHRAIDVVLMDLWMPFMDGYEATEKILGMDFGEPQGGRKPTVLAVTADVTDGALDRAAKVGMRGFMTKPFKLLDLQRLILEYCTMRAEDSGVEA